MRLYCCLLILLSLGTAQAYEFDTEAIKSCWNEGGIINFADFKEKDQLAYFTPEQCNNAESNKIDRNFFAAYAAEEMNKINDVMQAKLSPLWLDNQGNGEALVAESMNLYRTYNYCLESLCNLIYRDCAANSNRQENFQRCNNRRIQLLPLVENQIQMTLEGNMDRKTRSLSTEKMSTLSLRFDQWLHPRLYQVNISSAVIVKSILALAAYLW